MIVYAALKLGRTAVAPIAFTAQTLEETIALALAGKGARVEVNVQAIVAHSREGLR